MAGKKGPGSVEAAWLQTCWEWSGDLTKGTGCATQVSLSPTRRRGVWRVCVRALEVVDGKPAGIRAQVAGEYPCSERIELCAYIYALQMRLDKELMLDEMRREAGA